MGDVFAPSLIVVAFLSRLGFSGPGLPGASGQPGTKVAPGRITGRGHWRPAGPAQVAYLHIIGR